MLPIYCSQFHELVFWRFHDSEPLQNMLKPFLAEIYKQNLNLLKIHHLSAFISLLPRKQMFHSYSYNNISNLQPVKRHLISLDNFFDKMFVFFNDTQPAKKNKNESKQKCQYVNILYVDLQKSVHTL